MIFAVVVVLAYAIKCYKCQPNNAEITSAASKGNFSGLNLCSKPTDTVDCSQDPIIGSIADACYTASVTMNISLLNIGEISYHLQDCAVKSKCPDLKKLTCDTLKTAFTGISGFGISHCDISCCEEDLCNNPSSSAKSTHIPPNAAIFGILAFVTVAFISMF